MNYLNELQKTNVIIMDKQHAEIGSAVNIYFGTNDNSQESFKLFIERISELAKYHFGTEERLMLDSGYENYYSHKQEHDRFLRKVITYNLKEKDSLFIFIRDWFNNHLAMKDIKLGKYLAEQTGRVV